MKYTIKKSFSFEAAHWLPHVDMYHKCHRMHGHSFRVDVEVSGPLGVSGMVLDFAHISDAMKPIILQLDHRILNDVPGLENPTSENLAAWLVIELIRAGLAVSRLTVHETASSACTVTVE